MARLFGFIANRPDLGNRFIAAERAVLHTEAKGSGEDGSVEPWGWGIGFYQKGDILLKRRPLDDRRALDIVDMVGEVRSDLLISHVRRATIGELRAENTHPFRYRQWMFADTGSAISSAASEVWGQVREQVADSLPSFLQRAVRGETDSELLFYLFLSFLHDNGHLNHLQVSVDRTYQALKSSLGLLDRIVGKAGQKAPSLNMLLATPDYLLAVCRGRKMAYRLFVGAEDFQGIFADQADSKLRVPDLRPCRLAVVASDFDDDTIPEGWTLIPSGGIMAFTRTNAPIVVQDPVG